MSVPQKSIELLLLPTNFLGALVIGESTLSGVKTGRRGYNISTFLCVTILSWTSHWDQNVSLCVPPLSFRASSSLTKRAISESFAIGNFFSPRTQRIPYCLAFGHLETPLLLSKPLKPSGILAFDYKLMTSLSLQKVSRALSKDEKGFECQ